MKPFIFNEQEYKDLNSLGLAFVEHYDLALQCIKEKPWLKFFKNFIKICYNTDQVTLICKQ